MLKIVVAMMMLVGCVDSTPRDCGPMPTVVPINGKQMTPGGVFVISETDWFDHFIWTDQVASWGACMEAR